MSHGAAPSPERVVLARRPPAAEAAASSETQIGREIRPTTTTKTTASPTSKGELTTLPLRRGTEPRYARAEAGRAVAGLPSRGVLRPPLTRALAPRWGALFGRRRPPRIARVGNSITRGDARQEAGTLMPHKHKHNRGNFPAELATLLAGRAAVANFGHGGCSVLNTRPGASDEGATRSAWKPTVVPLMAGTNDSKESCRRTVHPRLPPDGAAAARAAVAPGAEMAPPPLIVSKSPWRPEFLRSEVVPRDLRRRLDPAPPPPERAPDDAGRGRPLPQPARRRCVRRVPRGPATATAPPFVDDGVHT